MKLLNYNLFIKLLMVLFWAAIFFVFLFSPLLKNQFQTNTLSILTFGDMIDLQQVAKFEKETGTKVVVNYYETNEELFAKLQVTKGREYDLITIADNALEYFQENDLVQEIDKSKLLFWNNIDPRILENSFDENYDHSIPYFWDVYGMGVNKKLLGEKIINNSWSLIFDHSVSPGKICMTDDPSNAILVAGQYLFGDVKTISKEQAKQITKLLLDQRDLLEIYTDLRSDYVLRVGQCPIAVTQSTKVYKIIKEDPNIGFIIPKEGGFKIFNLLVIPKLCNKADLVYKFLNYIFDADSMQKHCEQLGYLPVLSNVLHKIDLSHLGGLDYIFNPENYKKLAFFQSDISSTEVNKIWMQVKA